MSITFSIFLSRLRGTRKAGHPFWTIWTVLNHKASRSRGTNPIVSKTQRNLFLHLGQPFRDFRESLNMMLFTFLSAKTFWTSWTSVEQDTVEVCPASGVFRDLMSTAIFKILYDFQTTFWTICPRPSDTDCSTTKHFGHPTPRHWGHFEHNRFVWTIILDTLHPSRIRGRQPHRL